MKQNTQPIRGTKDYLPKEEKVRSYIKNVILSSYEKNGFLQVKTPILESLNLLRSSDGGDNVGLIYKLLKRGEKLDLTKPNLTEDDIAEDGLRYDLTVPLARFYANNKENLPTPFKAIQIDEAFRAERPQKGRLRQFTQCDIDIFGDESTNAEAEILTAALETYKKLGIKNITIKINDRQILNQLILNCGFEEKNIKDVLTALDKFDKIGKDGVNRELIEKGLSSTIVENLLKTIEDVKDNGIDSLNNNVDKNLITNIKELISTIKYFAPQDYNIIYDISIIRGQGYYTDIVFEVYVSDLGFAVGGGGRYNKMIGKLIGMPCPAVGFSIGLDRTIMALEQQCCDLSLNKKLALIYEKKSILEVMKLKQEFKKEFDVSLFRKPKNLNNLLDKLKACGFTSFAFADDETITIKDMQ